MRRYEANSCWRQFIELQAELSNWQPGIKDLNPFIARSRWKTAVAHFRFRTRQKKKRKSSENFRRGTHTLSPKAAKRPTQTFHMRSNVKT